MSVEFYHKLVEGRTHLNNFLRVLDTLFPQFLPKFGKTTTGEVMNLVMKAIK